MPRCIPPIDGESFLRKDEKEMLEQKETPSPRGGTASKGVDGIMEMANMHYE